MIRMDWAALGARGITATRIGRKRARRQSRDMSKHQRAACRPGGWSAAPTTHSTTALTSRNPPVHSNPEAPRKPLKPVEPVPANVNDHAHPEGEEAVHRKEGKRKGRHVQILSNYSHVVTRIPNRRLEPRKLPKQARSGATVEAILEAAAQIFERHGYAAGTTNRIAERAGVSIGPLYQYFPNKDAILLALVHQHLAEGTAALGPHLERLSRGARFDDVLPDIVNARVALHALAPGLHRVLFEETQLPPTLRAELGTGRPARRPHSGCARGRSALKSCRPPLVGPHRDQRDRGPHASSRTAPAVRGHPGGSCQ